MREDATPRKHGHDATITGACLTCDGPLRARITRAGVWAWCGRCRRLTRTLIMPGAAGAIVLQPTGVA